MNIAKYHLENDPVFFIDCRMATNAYPAHLDRPGCTVEMDFKEIDSRYHLQPVETRAFAGTVPAWLAQLSHNFDAIDIRDQPYASDMMALPFKNHLRTDKSLAAAIKAWKPSDSNTHDIILVGGRGLSGLVAQGSGPLKSVLSRSVPETYHPFSIYPDDKAIAFEAKIQELFGEPHLPSSSPETGPSTSIISKR